MKTAIELAELGLVPDPLIRWGIRRLSAKRLRQESLRRNNTEAWDIFIDELRKSPIALTPQKPNEQHYELPPEFFRHVLGKRMKYSACYWPEEIKTLDQAEEAMLELYAERARLEDGMEILELGCGWGSFALWIAEHYPRCRVLAVSNSLPQRKFIETECSRRGLSNVRVVTADINAFENSRVFDRIVSIEMFEHMRNYEVLLACIAKWLKPSGRLFIHIFRHIKFAYPYEVDGQEDWMGRYFFTGGLMPSDDLLLRFQNHLHVAEHWRMDGTHYQRTAQAWLTNLDAHRPAVLELFKSLYGPEVAKRWFMRWRLFFLACVEVFGYEQGQQWGVSHYAFKHPR